MKKLLIRIIGSVCILAAVLLLLLPTCVTVTEVSRKDMREYRNLITDSLEDVQEFLVEELSRGNSDLKDDLKDNDLPSTKSGVKKSIKNAEAIVESALNFDISFKEVLVLSSKAPRLINDATNLLETSLWQDLGALEEIEDIIETAAAFKGVFVLVILFFVLLIILTLASAVTHSLNKVRWLKYILIPILVLIVVGLSISVPVLNDLIQNEFELAAEFEDMTLRVTALPYISLVLAIVPVVLDIIFERKTKIREEK